MSNGERRVFWVQEHVRKRADGTEVTIPGHFRSEPPPPDTSLRKWDDEGDEGESQ